MAKETAKRKSPRRAAQRASRTGPGRKAGTPLSSNGRSLIIVESPAKAKTINKYLGAGYIVEASVGHIKNLPKSKLGIDVEAGFLPEYETIQGKEDVILRLRGRAERADRVYVATDPDREGEAIAWHIAQEVEPVNDNIFRVLFTEITERGIREAMKSPTRIDQNLVYSQQARRLMDRFVGYKVSPFVWKTLYYGLSAGRVQSVAVRLICEREQAVNSFIPVEYWSIIGEFQTAGSEPFLAKLFKIDGEDPSIPDEKTAEGYLSDIRKQRFVLADLQTKPVRRNPPPPFITSTLQQEAARRLRLPAKRTMMLAQKLYEGIELGDEGRIGLITYMRTDSTRISDDAVSEVREFIYSSFGKEYLPREPRHFRKGKGSQDAHEAIRPTSMKYAPKLIRKYLKDDLFSVYELIWNRFVACQMHVAVYDQTTVDIRGGEYLFRATDTIPRFRGFLQVYEESAEETDGQSENGDPTSKLPANLRIGETTGLTNLLPNQHFTKPPPRYTESSLVRELEALDIGRPSTYALIVGTILSRKYVESRDRRLYPTDLGEAVNRILVEHFPHLFNVKFTAQMEEELDTIAEGTNSYERVMEDFYRPFMEDLDGLDKRTGEIKKSLQEETDEVCDLCGKGMIIKWGRNGRFMACKGYPKCKNTKPLASELEQTKLAAGIKCNLCGSDMVVKGGRYGAFLGCSTYPECKNTMPLSIGVACPKCKEGYVIERKTTKRKRVFYGCSKYPECTFASWDKPVAQPCDTCGNAYMVSKYTQSRGDYLLCPSCKAEVAKEETVETNE